LKFTNVGPFDKVSFEFDEKVNVFIGPNNSGKSTVLAVIGEILVYPFALPLRLLRQNVLKCKWSGLFKFGGKLRRLSGQLPIGMGLIRALLFNQEISPDSKDFRRIQEQSNSDYKRYLPLLRGIGFTAFVPAIRYNTDYRSEGLLKEKAERPRRPPFEFEVQLPHPPEIIFPAAAPRPQQGPEERRRNALISTDPSLVSDESVVQKIIELDYMAYRKKEPGIRAIIDRIARVASEITEGFPIEFAGVGEDQRGLFPRFKTPDGDLPLSVLSQGTQSIVQWLGRLVLGYAQYYDFDDKFQEKPGILIIDEIDAHLHPSWQQRIIPVLQKEFPNLQLFFSTHSPLMLAGLRKSQIHLLQRDTRGRIHVTTNERDIIGWSSDEILRGLMGIGAPTDLETSSRVQRLKELRAKPTLTPKEKSELEALRTFVGSNLLSGPLEDQLTDLRSIVRGRHRGMKTHGLNRNATSGRRA
jgi:energy-coupling factor transporter ATP-binding protein EcfA2